MQSIIHGSVIVSELHLYLFHPPLCLLLHRQLLQNKKSYSVKFVKEVAISDSKSTAPVKIIVVGFIG
jgi:hypothetical protein